MSFNFIIDPATLESYSIFSKEGVTLLKKYVKDYQTGGGGGGANQAPDIPLLPDIPLPADFDPNFIPGNGEFGSTPPPLLRQHMDNRDDDDDGGLPNSNPPINNDPNNPTDSEA